MSDQGMAMSSDKGDLIRQLAEARAESAALKARLVKATTRRLVLKVSDKGAVSLYGMGRFPVTLYRQQWEKVLDYHQDIRDFIKDNDTLLTTKD